MSDQQFSSVMPMAPQSVPPPPAPQQYIAPAQSTPTMASMTPTVSYVMQPCDCYSGWAIFWILVLLSIINGYTIASTVVGVILFIGAIVFYIWQPSITGCRPCRI